VTQNGQARYGDLYLKRMTRRSRTAGELVDWLAGKCGDPTGAKTLDALSPLLEKLGISMWSEAHPLPCDG
jgi:hypothetical protein